MSISPRVLPAVSLPAHKANPAAVNLLLAAGVPVDPALLVSETEAAHTAPVLVSESALLYSGDPMNYPYPGIPEGWTDYNKRRAEEVLGRCQMLFGDAFAQHVSAVSPQADIEDFWENAARAAAAFRAASTTGQQIQVCEQAQWSPAQLDRRLGAVLTIEEDRHGHDPLLQHPVLTENAGRWMAVGALPEDPLDDRDDNIVTQLVARHAAGVTHAVLKLAVRKTGLIKIELCADPQELYRRIMGADEDLTWTLISIMDRAGAVLAQDFIPMSYEYRLFVVDGKLVSGAGCIVEHTPFNQVLPHDPNMTAFSPLMRQRRGNGLVADESSKVVPRPLLRRRYLEFGAALAAQYAGTVVIDVAVNEETNELLVVELNTLPNAGFYAADTDRIYQKLATADDHGYGCYGFAKRTLSDYLA